MILPCFEKHRGSRCSDDMEKREKKDIFIRLGQGLYSQHTETYLSKQKKSFDTDQSDTCSPQSLSMTTVT